MGRVTRRQRVLRIGAEGTAATVDTVAVEEPLEIRLDGRPFQVMMRTPGDDIDLVHGLLYAEQVITDATQVLLARYCAGTGPDGLNTYNVVEVSLGAGAEFPEPGLQRNVLTTSACGTCGAASIEQVTKVARFPLSPTGVSSSVLVAAPRRVRTQQKAFAKTGGVHAAALIDLSGAVLCVREDVGRHNAVDKVIGWALRQGRLPLSDTILLVTSRASFELAQKAVLAGIGILAAVSAPSSLAIELAEQTGLTLVGFVRESSMNVYTHDYRVEPPAPPRLRGARDVASGDPTTGRAAR